MSHYNNCATIRMGLPVSALIVPSLLLTVEVVLVFHARDSDSGFFKQRLKRASNGGIQ